MLDVNVALRGIAVPAVVTLAAAFDGRCDAERMTDWRRPYEPNAPMLVGAIMAGAGIVFGVVLTLVLIADAVWDLRIKVADLAVPYGVAAMSVAVGAYRYRVGVYHNDTGVRIQYLIRSRLVPWSSIATIENRAIPVSSRREVRVIVLVTVGGAEIVTPLGCVVGGAAVGPGRDFRAAQRHLSAGDYTRALGILQRGLIAARRRAPQPPS